jgi:hypothetical protein
MYELKTYSKNKKEYMSDLWNFFDFFLIAINLTIINLDFFYTYVTPQVILNTLMLLLIFTKICFYLRISDGFSFLVSMLIGVFADLKFFFLFYIIMLVMFTLIFLNLTLTLDENMSTVSGGFGYLILAFRTSLGDF